MWEYHTRLKESDVIAVTRRLATTRDLFFLRAVIDITAANRAGLLKWPNPVRTSES
jgi:hypothetical protein